MRDGKAWVAYECSQGIGKACAAALLEAGASVMITAHTPAVLAEAEAELAPLGTVASHAADVADRRSAEELVEHTVQTLGPPDILVCCHGIVGVNGPFLETTAEDWNEVLSVNLMGVVTMCRLAGRHIAPYDASKAAVIQLTRCVALDLWPLGIRVNGVAPGFADTPMAEPWLADVRAKTLTCNITGKAPGPKRSRRSSPSSAVPRRPTSSA